MPATARGVLEDQSTASLDCTVGQAAVLADTTATHQLALRPRSRLVREVLVTHTGQYRSSGTPLAHDVVTSSTCEELERMRPLNAHQRILMATVTYPKAVFGL
jgi:hypothetical protein